MSCANGHLHVAQWLIDLGRKCNSSIDIYARNEFAFRESCTNGHLHVAQWLTTLIEIVIHQLIFTCISKIVKLCAIINK